MPLDPGQTFLIGVGVTLGGWFVAHRLARARDRESLLRRIVETYVERANAPGGQPSDDFWRHGTLQTLGAADITQRELDWVCQRIIARALPDPRTFDLPKFRDRRKHLRGLLRWAAREHIDLGDGDAVMLRLATEADDWVQGRGKQP